MNEAFTQQDLLATSTHSIDSHLEQEAKQPEANVTEIIIARSQTDSVQMLLPMLTRLNQERRWLAWIDPPIELLKKWKQERNTELDEIMVLRSNDDTSSFELCEKALAAGTCHAVILWTHGLSNENFEHLERASIEGDSHGIVLRSR